jgi:uncharacterized membrane protein
LVAIIIIVVLSTFEILIERDTDTWFGKLIRWLRTRDQMSKVIFTITVLGLSVAAVMYWYSYPENGWKDLVQGLTAEIIGGLIDLAIIGVIIGIYEEKRRRQAELNEKERAEQARLIALERRSREEIADGIAVKNEEGKVNVWRGIHRLNEIEVYDINLAFADLSKSNPREMAIPNKAIIRKGRLFRTNFTHKNLSDSEFSDSRISESSFENAALLRVHFDGSRIQDSSFKGSKCPLASFKAVIFSGEIVFDGADISKTSFEGATGKNMSFDECIVGPDFRERVLSWNIDTESFFKGHALISRHYTIRYPDGTDDAREEWRIVDYRKYKDTQEFLMRTLAEKEYSLETIELEEE